MKLQAEFAILPLRQKLEQGVALFNDRSFFDCHDLFEEIWRESTGKDRLFFQGIIHIAVGFYHLENENSRGARSQLSKGITKLQQFQTAYHGIELREFLTQTSRCLEWVMQREQGIEQGPFDAASIPRLQIVNQ